MTTEQKPGIATPTTSPELQMLRLTAGHLTAQAVHVFATLGLADILRDAPKNATELAQITKSDAAVLYRMLRFLGTIDVVQEKENGVFHLTRFGQTLCRKPTSVIHDNTLLVASRPYWTAIGNLLQSVKTGRNAFHDASGQSYFECIAGDPDEAAIFNAAMNSSSMLGVPAILAAYDFSGFREIVDVAGGKGALITGILKKHKSVRGVLFDAAEALDHLAFDAAVSDRLTKVRGSFFEDIPAGADAYVMRRVLHDWDDENAIKILRQCRQAMRPDSNLILIELATAENEKVNQDWATMDLLMMLVLNGRERTASEFAQIMEAAGLRLERAVPTRSPYWIIEASQT